MADTADSIHHLLMVDGVGPTDTTTEETGPEADV